MSSNAHFLIYFPLCIQFSTLQAVSSLTKNASVFIGGDFLFHKSNKNCNLMQYIYSQLSF